MRALAATCGRAAPGDTVVSVPEAPRLPLRVIALSTALAFCAAVGTYALLADDDGARSTDGTIQLTLEDPDGATFTTFEGETVALSLLRGTPLLVNFFASSCVPCITEMPHLEEVHREVGDQVTFLGLAPATYELQIRDQGRLQATRQITFHGPVLADLEIAPSADSPGGGGRR